MVYITRIFRPHIHHRWNPRLITLRRGTKRNQPWVPTMHIHELMKFESFKLDYKYLEFYLTQRFHDLHIEIMHEFKKQYQIFGSLSNYFKSYTCTSLKFYLTNILSLWLWGL